MEEYEGRKVAAVRNLRLYLVFCTLFTVFNVIVIRFVPGYSFPHNFFAIWPIIGWGVPTAFRFIEVSRYAPRD